MTEIAAAFTLGLAGSLHCVLMCGPLVLALRPVRGPARLAVYHGARVSMYAAVGVVGGLAGQVLDVAGVGRALSIITGVVLLAIAVGRMRGITVGSPRAAGSIGRWLSHAVGTARRVMDERPIVGTMAAGALNACLPCGLLYIALAAAATLGSAPSAVAFMLAFGVGTLGPLAAASLVAHAIPIGVRTRAPMVVPATIMLVGLLLIMRGTLPAATPPTATAGTAAHHVHVR